MGKYELMYLPIFRGVFKKFKLIPVKRGRGSKEVMKVKEMGKERLSTGNWIIIFPEGTRMEYNKLCYPFGIIFNLTLVIISYLI